MNSLLSSEQFEERKLEDAAKMQRASLDFATVIGQHDALTAQIVTDLGQILNDLDALAAIDREIGQHDKETVQRITSLLAMDVKHNGPTIAARIRDAKNLILNG
jgi:hypothetical protein